VVEFRRAGSTTVAFGDAKNIVDKIRASAGVTASIGVQGTQQEASSSNFVAGVDALSRLLDKVPK
jgi:hypothetical protein